MASPSDQICNDWFLSIHRKINWIPQIGERSCHFPPPVNPLCNMSIYKDFGPPLPHLKALCNCMRDSTPRQSSTAAFKGSLLLPSQKNLDQRNTRQAHSCRFELENGVHPGTPSLPHNGWLPCRTVGGMSSNQWRIPGAPSSSVYPPTSHWPLQHPQNLELVAVVHKSGAGVSLVQTIPPCTFSLVGLWSSAKHLKRPSQSLLGGLDRNRP